MIPPQIIGLFPTPIYKNKLGRKLTQKELDLVKDTRAKCVPNRGNVTSADIDILSHPSFVDLKKEMDLFIKDYFSKIIFSSKSTFPYITQSWLNYTGVNEYHPPHNHSNSYLSAVFYIDAQKAHDKIIFSDNKYDQIRIAFTKWSPFNSGTWAFAVESGDLMMFPSHLTHFVPKKEGNNTRISLSFNVFVKGDLGDARQLTGLRL